MKNQSELERYRGALEEIARQNPNQMWSERDLHNQVSAIIRFAREVLHGSPKPPKAVKVPLARPN